ncbi:MAG: ribonuclease R [Verrucomicrobia bacterium]|nr:ribonuclease R [Verrucomicrobiota bacterium]
MGSSKGVAQALEQRVLSLLGNAKYQPLDKTDLAKKLGVPVDQRAGFRKLLGQLEAVGKITRIRKDRYVLPQAADLIAGVILINPQGFGYVVNESGDGEGDVYIPASYTSTALHRDRVVARITDEPSPALRGSRKRVGKVIKILERANSRIVGTLQQSQKFYYVVPDDPRLVHDIYVPMAADGSGRRPVVNDKVVVRLEAWDNRHVNPEGEIIEVLGPARDPKVEMLGIIKKHGLPGDFPENVLREAGEIQSDIPASELNKRFDLRHLPIFTIDPEDARDFDDAIHVEQIKGGWEVGIHIADVSHYVRPRSALDREAFQRGNSVYLPDRVIPMLPERLSNGVCSLRPDEDHLTKSVLVRFDRNGRQKGFRLAATVIRSRSRLTYREAYERLISSSDDALTLDLKLAWDLASKLRQKRFQVGALDLDMPEVRVKVDQEGRAIGLIREENDISHQLIEEFMLLANEIVGRETKVRSIVSVYRIHEDPDPEKLMELRELLLSQGIEIGDLSNRAEMQKFLKKIAGRPDEGALKVSLLRSLRKAGYSGLSLGHYGLAKADYSHFTSPIRRYADLVTHRAFNVLLGRPNALKQLPRFSQLESICEHLALTERSAADAEREASRLKKLDYLESLLRKPHQFSGVVTEVRNYGLLVEVLDIQLVGLVHVSSLEEDFYTFDAVRRRLIGRRRKRTYQIGDVLPVRVARVDRFKQQVDFAITKRN